MRHGKTWGGKERQALTALRLRFDPWTPRHNGEFKVRHDTTSDCHFRHLSLGRQGGVDSDSRAQDKMAKRRMDKGRDICKI